MTFPEPLLRVWNINRRDALPAWPHRRRRRWHGRQPRQRRERVRQWERISQITSRFVLFVCVCLCVSPMNNSRVHDLCAVWVNFVSEFGNNLSMRYQLHLHSLICCSNSLVLFLDLHMSFSLSFFIAQTFEINQIVNTTKCSPKTCKHFVRSASCVRSIDEREFYYYFFHSENSQLLQGENIHVYMVVSSTYLQRFWLSIYAVFAFSGWKFVKFVAEVTWNFSVNSK